jgi:hypothetical protein
MMINTQYRIVARSAGSRSRYPGGENDGVVYVLVVDHGAVRATALDRRAAHARQFDLSRRPVRERVRLSPARLATGAAHL